MNYKFSLIEDEVNTLFGLQSRLNSLGFEAVTTNTEYGIEHIVESISLKKPSFIILEAVQNNLDGFQLISRFKTDQLLSTIPLFIYSKLDRSLASKLKEHLGIRYIFFKEDIGIEELVSKILIIIKNKHSKS